MILTSALVSAPFSACYSFYIIALPWICSALTVLCFARCWYRQIFPQTITCVVTCSELSYLLCSPLLFSSVSTWSPCFCLDAVMYALLAAFTREHVAVLSALGCHICYAPYFYHHVLLTSTLSCLLFRSRYLQVIETHWSHFRTALF